MRSFSKRTIRRMDLSNCITDGITTCINNNMGMQSAYLFFNDFPYLLTFLINIHANANYVCYMICIYMRQMHKRSMSKL